MSAPLAILNALGCGRSGCPCLAASSRGKGPTHCPAHEDHTPSLSVAPGRTQPVVVSCLAGCDQAAVITALRERRLWPDDRRNGHIPRGMARAGNRLTKTTRYEVRAVTGELVAVHVRQERADGSKTFSWQQPNSARGLNGTKTTDLPLYGAELLATAAPGSRVIVCEGEKAALALRARDVLALGTITGARSTPSPAALASLAGFDVVLWPDHDNTGREHMERVAAVFSGLGITPRLVDWPDAPAKGDAADFTGSDAELVALLDAALSWSPVELAAPSPASDPEPGPGRVSASRLLLDIIHRDAELFHDPSGDAYASVTMGDHRETYPVRSSAFRGWLVARFFAAHQRAPGAQAREDALSTAEALGRFGGPERVVSLRVAAGPDGAVYLDLADDDWRVVRIDATGWRVLPAADAPVTFRRSNGMRSLPLPVAGGSLDELRELLNVSDADWPLIVGWERAALRPTGPYPLLRLAGEQGSAKSTTARMLRALVDPAAPELRAEPREARDLAVAGHSAWLLAFDNLSHLPVWLCDALCRLATGGGFATRTNYTDADETVFDATRPVTLTGIGDDLVSRADLLDRTVSVVLPAIPDTKRRPERELWAAFDALRPRLFGALLDSLAAGLRELPSVRLERLPRLADFALWAVACERGMGEEPRFLDAYDAVRASGHDAALEASSIGPHLLAVLELSGDAWSGTAAELLDELAKQAGDTATRRQRWPSSPRGLASELRRLAPALRAQGVELDWTRSGHARTRTLHIMTAKVGEQTSASSASSALNSKHGQHADGWPPGADGCEVADGRQPSAPESTFELTADGADGADGRSAISPNGPASMANAAGEREVLLL